MRAHLPLVREEMTALLDLFVPVGFDERRHLSASYREVIGTVYLTLHPWRMTMVEAVVHEFSHNKLNAALWFDPMLENAPTETYRSPVRPDPRPLLGLLLAVHAFVPIGELYRLLASSGAEESRDGGFPQRFAEIIDKNEEGLSVLRAHARPTAAGRALLGDLAAIHARAAALRGDLPRRDDATGGAAGPE